MSKPLAFDQIKGTARQSIAYDRCPPCTRNNAPAELAQVTIIDRDIVGPRARVEFWLTVGKGKPRKYAPSELLRAIDEYNRLTGHQLDPLQTVLLTH